MKNDYITAIKKEKKNLMIELDQAITKNHTGKMEGMQSLSTSCLDNPYCQERRENGSNICAKCYAARELSRKKTLREKLARNTELLTKTVFAPEDIPFINARYFRFEAFGEIRNDLQVRNYFLICEKNPGVNFALWTKNYWIVDRVLTKYHIQKPKNLNIIASVEKIDCPHFDDVQQVKENFECAGIDKIFCVYTKKYADDHNIKINCGSKKCIDCLKCFNKKDRDFVIRELLK